MACSSYTNMNTEIADISVVFPYYWILGSSHESHAVAWSGNAPNVSCLGWTDTAGYAAATIPFVWNEGTQRWISSEDWIGNNNEDRYWREITNTSDLSDVEWQSTKIGNRVHAFKENLLYALDKVPSLDVSRGAVAHPAGYFLLGQIMSGTTPWMSEGYPADYIEGKYWAKSEGGSTSTASIRPITHRIDSARTASEMKLTVQFNERPTLDQTVPYYDWLCLYHEHTAKLLADTHSTHAQVGKEKSNIAAVRKWYKDRGWKESQASTEAMQKKAHALLEDRIERAKGKKVTHLARTYFVKWLTGYSAAEAAGAASLAEYLASQEGSSPQVEPQDPEMLEDIDWAMEEVAKTKLQEALPWIVLGSSMVLLSGSFWWFRKKQRELV